jgi:hypothetical protein
MAKNLSFRIGSNVFAAGITKIDRDKVYGFVEEVVLDKDGAPCTTGNLLDDGQTVILSGATALKTVDEHGAEVDKHQLKMVYADGADAVLVPSSYDGDVALQPATLNDLFNLEVNTVYQLTWEDAAQKSAMLAQLEGGAVYRFVFNYRADYEGADAIVLAAQQEVFALTGRMLEPEYLENKTAVPIAEPEASNEEEEELDFGML